MRIVIAGGHGKIALLLSRLLADAGHEPVGIIRKPEQADDLRAAGALPLVLDLEHSTVTELADALAGSDATVFAAGAGPDSGADRKLTLDRDGAVLLAEASVRAGVRRLIVISSMGADGFDETSDDVFQVYLRAKSEADAAVRAMDLDWTIVRPGALTDSEPDGSVTIGESVDRGSIPRADVAALVTALIVGAAGVRRQFEAVSGPTPIAEAVGAL
ncbi:SDR family oxidoreductase [Lacisediminihabitans sp. FW035]